MSITRIRKRVAVFYNNRGDEIGSKGFSRSQAIIKFDGGSYNSPNCFTERISYTTFYRWYWDVDTYHYILGNPNPVQLDKRGEPLINSDVYHTLLENKRMLELNELSKPKSILLNWKFLLIFGIVALIVILSLTGVIDIKS